MWLLTCGHRRVTSTTALNLEQGAVTALSSIHLYFNVDSRATKIVDPFIDEASKSSKTQAKRRKTKSITVSKDVDNNSGKFTILRVLCTSGPSLPFSLNFASEKLQSDLLQQLVNAISFSTHRFCTCE